MLQKKVRNVSLTTGKRTYSERKVGDVVIVGLEDVTEEDLDGGDCAAESQRAKNREEMKDKREATMLALEMRTPLGAPVDPEVYMMVAMSSGLGLLAGTGFLAPSSMNCSKV